MATTKAATRYMNFAPVWTSGNLTWVAGTAQTVNHALGRKPYLIRTCYVCVTAHSQGGVNYAVGDEIDGQALSDTSNFFNILIQQVTPTLIRFRPHNMSFGLGSYTHANWRVRIDLW